MGFSFMQGSMFSARGEQKAKKRLLKDSNHLAALCLVAQYKNMPLQLKEVRIDFDPYLSWYRALSDGKTTLVVPYETLAKYMLNFPTCTHNNTNMNWSLRVKDKLLITTSNHNCIVLRSFDQLRSMVNEDASYGLALEEYPRFANNYNVCFKDSECTNIREWSRFYISHFNIFNQMCNGNAPIW